MSYVTPISVDIMGVGYEIDPTVKKQIANHNENRLAHNDIRDLITDLQRQIDSAPDTKNTAGATDTSSKIFLVGATTQGSNPQTYSHNTVYVDTAGCLNTTTPTEGDNSTKAATTKFVQDAIDNVLVSEMTFKGVTTTLPATPINGDMYKVTADIAKASNMDNAAKAGDTIIYSASSQLWHIIESSDDTHYTKPKDGIPDSDLTQSIQSSLTAADTAVQSVKINGGDELKSGTVVDLPAYPTKSSLGLANVDNTSDIDKPISTATQNALNGKYEKPTEGIPKSDLTQDVQTLLGYLDGVTVNIQTQINSMPDTKNTAGATNTDSKIYLVGATEQGDNLQTYSHDTVYIDETGVLNSVTPEANNNSTQVATTAFVKQSIDNAVGSVVVFRGKTSTLPTTPTNGDMYKVIEAIAKADNMDSEAQIGDIIVYSDTDSMWYIL